MKMKFGFKFKQGFTLIELLVVIAIIALLLSIIVPSLRLAKEKAKSVLCSSQQKQVFLSLNLYAVNNNDSTVIGWTGWQKYDDTSNGGVGGLWMDSLRNYTDDLDDLCLCPMTKKPETEGYYPISDTSKKAWGIFPDATGSGSADNWAQAGSYGSLGMNGWVCNVPKEVTDSYPAGQGLINSGNASKFWRKMGIPQPFSVPLIADCAFDTGWPESTNEIPMTEDGIGVDGSDDSKNMLRFAIDRHRWRVNVTFMDGSIKTMDLLSLWLDVKWHKSYSSSFPRRYVEVKGKPEWAR